MLYLGNVELRQGLRLAGLLQGHRGSTPPAWAQLQGVPWLQLTWRRVQAAMVCMAGMPLDGCKPCNSKGRLSRGLH